jgi:CHAT domain-containing protein/tetratricopeptide (TPR) repeat protein
MVDEQAIMQLNQQVVLCYQQGKRGEALGLGTRAVELARQILGGEHLETARTLNNLGSVLESMGELARARSCHEQALAIRRKGLGEEHPDTATSLNNLRAVLCALGDFVGARDCLEQALAINRTALGRESPNLAGSLNNLGYLLQEMGELRAARPYFEQALAIRREIQGDEHPDLANDLTNLGALLQEMGDLAGARHHLEQALAIRQECLGDKHPDTAASLNNLGSLLQAMGDLTEALRCCSRALTIRRAALGEEHRDTATSLNNLGTLLYAVGDPGGAKNCFERVLAIKCKVLGEEHPDTATSLNNLGSLLESMGDLAGARSYLERALAIKRKVLGEEHPDTATSLNNLGALLYNMGDLAEASLYFAKALAISQKVLGHEHPDTAGSLLNACGMLVGLGRADEGFALAQAAAAIDDRMIGQVSLIGSDSQRLAYLHGVQANTQFLLSVVVGHLAHSWEAVRAALDLVLRRKAVAAEALASQRDAILGGRYPQLYPAMQELTHLRKRIARMSMSGPAPGESQGQRQQTLNQLRAEQERRETVLARQIPEMDLWQRLRSVDRLAVALSLPEGSALVEFVRSNLFDFRAVFSRGKPQVQPSRYLAFVLLAGQPDDVRMVDLGEAETMDRLIADFRAEIASPTDSHSRHLSASPSRPASGAALSRRLRELVFDPLLPALQGRTRLLVSPDGELARLPFEVLPGDGEELLIDGYSISYVCSGRDVLCFGRVSDRSPGEPIVLADPEFDLGPEPPRGSSYRFGPLSGARAEGQRVAELLGVQPWLGKSARVERLAKECRSPRILHLATHGFYFTDEAYHRDAEGPHRLRWPPPQNPLLRSGLALCGANDWLAGGDLPEEAEDGVLTAEDVSGLDLMDTELVVLSACETGLGQVHTGEGVFGLQRAFILAGAKTLVMSLWAVPDEATRLLTEDFYQRILSGQPRAEALRQAQQALRARHPEPLYWGAFVCLGDPGPLHT